MCCRILAGKNIINVRGIAHDQLPCISMLRPIVIFARAGENTWLARSDTF